MTLADSYLIPTAFGIGLMKHPRSNEVPEQLLEFLKILIDSNRERNNNIIQQYNKLVNWLGTENIFPMKGIALLLNGVYKDHAMQILSDIDVLVPSDKLYHFANILKEQGYSIKKKKKRGQVHCFIALSANPTIGIPRSFILRCKFFFMIWFDANGLQINNCKSTIVDVVDIKAIVFSGAAHCGVKSD